MLGLPTVTYCTENEWTPASAEQSLLIAQQRFALLLEDAVKKADEAELMRRSASEATDKALNELGSRLDAVHEKLAQAVVREATAEAQREGRWPRQSI